MFKKYWTTSLGFIYNSAYNSDRIYVFNLGINKHAILITITITWKDQFFLLKFHHRITNATQDLLSKDRFGQRWRNALVKNLRGMEQYDWLWNRLLHRLWFYTTTNTSLMENFKYGWKKWHDKTFSLRKFSKGQVFWATSNPWTRNLTFVEIHLKGKSELFSPSCPPHKLLPQITLSWTQNSWLTSALLHRCLNKP
jgi:hypothetical protein